MLPNIGTPLATQRLQACHVLLAQPRVQVWGLGFRVWSEGFRVWGLGFRVGVKTLGFGVWEPVVHGPGAPFAKAVFYILRNSNISQCITSALCESCRLRARCLFSHTH